MPNHITNRITSADPEVFKCIAEALKGDEAAVDFNRLIPMPEVLKSGNSVPAVEDRAKVILGITPLRDILRRAQSNRYAAEDFMQQLADTNTLRSLFEGEPVKDWSDEEFERLVLYMRALRQHGHASWYEWSIENWGTKWNAYDVSVDDGAVRFDTAWSCPEPIVRKLAEAVPGPWTWDYADEDIGSNCGTWVAHPDEDPGVPMLVEPESGEMAVRFACALRGRDYDEYMAGREEDEDDAA